MHTPNIQSTHSIIHYSFSIAQAHTHTLSPSSYIAWNVLTNKQSNRNNKLQKQHEATNNNNASQERNNTNESKRIKQKKANECDEKRRTESKEMKRRKAKNNK